MTEATTLIENAGMDYPTFEAEWGDYIRDIADEEVTFERYDEIRQDLEHHYVQGGHMYRTIHVSPDWLQSLLHTDIPVGVHWTVNKSLRWQPSTDPYDTRFAFPQGTPVTIVLTAQIPASNSVDWNGTVASAWATSEEEIRVVENAVIRIIGILMDGKPVPLTHPISRPA